MLPSLLAAHGENDAIRHSDKLSISRALSVSDLLDPQILKSPLGKDRKGFPPKNGVQNFALTNPLWPCLAKG